MNSLSEAGASRRNVSIGATRRNRCRGALEDKVNEELLAFIKG